MESKERFAHGKEELWIWKPINIFSIVLSFIYSLFACSFCIFLLFRDSRSIAFTCVFFILVGIIIGFTAIEILYSKLKIYLTIDKKDKLIYSSTKVSLKGFIALCIMLVISFGLGIAYFVLALPFDPKNGWIVISLIISLIFYIGNFICVVLIYRNIKKKGIYPQKEMDFLYGSIVFYQVISLIFFASFTQDIRVFFPDNIILGSVAFLFMVSINLEHLFLDFYLNKQQIKILRFDGIEEKLENYIK